jgi:hypothetical protein
MSDPGAPQFDLPNLGELQAEVGSSVGATRDGGDAARVRSVLERHRQALMTADEVVMVGEGQDELGQPAIVVGLKRRPATALPASIEGVRIITIVIGEVDALGAPGRR